MAMVTPRTPRRRLYKRPTGRPAPRVRPERDVASRVELITIGRELLRGTISDENARALAHEVSRRGGILRRITTVDDEEASIAAALREALDRNPHLVVTAGGLGPGEHDRTLGAVSDVLGLPLVLHTGAQELVEGAYRRLAERGLAAPAGLTAAREKVCTLPVGAEALTNALGVAPGVLCRLSGGAAVLCLPGRPDEARTVFVEGLGALGPLGWRRQVAQRSIEAPTADESALVPLLDRLALEFPGVWIDSQPGEPRGRDPRVMINLEATGADRQEAEAAVDGAVRRLLALAAGSP
jgi:molybdenum cofactor synthesis domain-containing protein